MLISNMNLDLVTLTNWYPPEDVCNTCGALLETKKHKWVEKESSSGNGLEKVFTCPICESEATAYWNRESLRFVPDTERGYQRTAISKLQILGSVASAFPPHTSINDMDKQPLLLLYEALSAAQNFIHFATFSIDTAMLGTLAILASKGIRVRGIVGNPKNNSFINTTAEVMMDSINKGSFPPPFLIAVEGFNTNSDEPTHKKLIVIDGLLAFKGSANLSINAWTKASKLSKSEQIEVNSRPEEVAIINNEYFSPSWMKHKHLFEKYRLF